VGNESFLVARHGTRCVSQIQDYCFISQLVTVVLTSRYTRPAKGALRPEGRIPSDCYHDCLLVLWSTVFPIPRAMEYSISNPSYYGVQGLPFPIPDIHMAERLTLSFTYRKRCTTSRLRHTTG
jgi:hypothetical protein